jgi:hypothetical protein
MDLADHPVELDYAPVDTTSATVILAPESVSPDRCSRVRYMLTECNFLLSLVDDEEQLLDGICRLIVEAGGYRKAWISLSDLPPGLARTGSAAPGAAQPVTRDYCYASTETGPVGSGVALPLKDQFSTFGALMVYSLEADRFDEEELNLLIQLTANLAFSIIARRDEFSDRIDSSPVLFLVSENAVLPDR